MDESLKWNVRARMKESLVSFWDWETEGTSREESLGENTLEHMVDAATLVYIAAVESSEQAIKDKITDK